MDILKELFGTSDEMQISKSLFGSETSSAPVELGLDHPLPSPSRDYLTPRPLPLLSTEPRPQTTPITSSLIRSHSLDDLHGASNNDTAPRLTTRADPLRAQSVFPQLSETGTANHVNLHNVPHEMPAVLLEDDEANDEEVMRLLETTVDSSPDHSGRASVDSGGASYSSSSTSPVSNGWGEANVSRGWVAVDMTLLEMVAMEMVSTAIVGDAAEVIEEAKKCAADSTVLKIMSDGMGMEVSERAPTQLSCTSETVVETLVTGGSCSLSLNGPSSSEPEQASVPSPPSSLSSTSPPSPPSVSSSSVDTTHLSPSSSSSSLASHEPSTLTEAGGHPGMCIADKPCSSSKIVAAPTSTMTTAITVPTNATTTAITMPTDAMTTAVTMPTNAMTTAITVPTNTMATAAPVSLAVYSGRSHSLSPPRLPPPPPPLPSSLSLSPVRGVLPLSLSLDLRLPRPPSTPLHTPTPSPCSTPLLPQTPAPHPKVSTPHPTNNLPHSTPTTTPTSVTSTPVLPRSTPVSSPSPTPVFQAPPITPPLPSPAPPLTPPLPLPATPITPPLPSSVTPNKTPPLPSSTTPVVPPLPFSATPITPPLPSRAPPSMQQCIQQLRQQIVLQGRRLEVALKSFRPQPREQFRSGQAARSGSGQATTSSSGQAATSGSGQDIKPVLNTTRDDVNNDYPSVRNTTLGNALQVSPSSQSCDNHVTSFDVTGTASVPVAMVSMCSIATQAGSGLKSSANISNPVPMETTSPSQPKLQSPHCETIDECNSSKNSNTSKADDVTDGSDEVMCQAVDREKSNTDNSSAPLVAMDNSHTHHDDESCVTETPEFDDISDSAPQTTPTATAEEGNDSVGRGQSQLLSNEFARDADKNLRLESDVGGCATDVTITTGGVCVSTGVNSHVTETVATSECTTTSNHSQVPKLVSPAVSPFHSTFSVCVPAMDWRVQSFGSVCGMKALPITILPPVTTSQTSPPALDSQVLSSDKQKTTKRRRNGGGWPKGKRRKIVTSDLPKPPTTAYGLYLTDQRQGMGSVQSMSQLSKTVGKMWSNLPQHVKQEYEEKAVQDRKRYLDDLKTHFINRQKENGCCNLESIEAFLKQLVSTAEDCNLLHCGLCQLSFRSVHNKQSHYCSRLHTDAVLRELDRIVGGAKSKRCSSPCSMHGTVCGTEERMESCQAGMECGTVIGKEQCSNDNSTQIPVTESHDNHMTGRAESHDNHDTSGAESHDNHVMNKAGVPNGSVDGDITSAQCNACEAGAPCDDGTAPIYRTTVQTDDSDTSQDACQSNDVIVEGNSPTSCGSLVDTSLMEWSQCYADALQQLKQHTSPHHPLPLTPTTHQSSSGTTGLTSFLNRFREQEQGLIKHIDTLLELLESLTSSSYQD